MPSQVIAAKMVPMRHRVVEKRFKSSNYGATRSIGAKGEKGGGGEKKGRKRKAGIF